MTICALAPCFAFIEAGALVIAIAFVAFGLFAGLLVWSLIWVHDDAEARGKPGWLVAALAFFLSWPVSLLVWYVLRPELPPGRAHRRRF
jgi:hypothetical protein